MKKTLTTLAILLQISWVGYAQYYSNPNLNADQTEILKKVTEFNKVKNTGFKLLAGGGAATIFGIVLLSNVEFYVDQYGNSVTDDGGSLLGGFISVVYIGAPLITSGTILSIIGNAKEKSYVRKLEKVSVSYFNQQGANGFRLVYNF